MSAQPHQLPYVDHSRTDGAASFVSTLPPPSCLSADTESLAPLLNDSRNESATHRTKPPLVATPGQPAPPSSQDAGDKIIMTSIPITLASASSPASRSLFARSKPKQKLKIVLMPQSEYAKYFARDKSGAYVGSEAERSWSEEELDERYGKYKSALPPAPMRAGSALKDGGGFGAIAGYGNF